MNKTQASVPLYPVTLVLSGQPCLVVGGGPVGYRKVHNLLLSQAEVTLVAPELCPQLEQLASGKMAEEVDEAGIGDALELKSFKVHRRDYEKGEASNYRLVFAATSNRNVNRQVFQDAQEAGIFVNTADDPQGCTFMLPSIARFDPVTIAVSSGGSSPALAIWIRNQITTHFGSNLSAIAQLLFRARCVLHDKGISTEAVDWNEILETGLLDIVSQGDLQGAERFLMHSVNTQLGTC